MMCTFYFWNWKYRCFGFQKQWFLSCFAISKGESEPDSSLQMRFHLAAGLSTGQSGADWTVWRADCLEGHFESVGNLYRWSKRLQRLRWLQWWMWCASLGNHRHPVLQQLHGLDAHHARKRTDLENAFNN